MALLLAIAAPKAGETHAFGLQWIDGIGVATVSDDGGKTVVMGKHTGKDGDFISINGAIEQPSETGFTFVGVIVTRVSHIAGGKACTRKGTFTFRATGKRRYWRMKENGNPCDGAADYVDIYFEREERSFA